MCFVDLGFSFLFELITKKTSALNFRFVKNSIIFIFVNKKL